MPAGLSAPSLVAAVNFTLMGTALLALDAGNGWRVRPSEALSLAMGLLAFMGLEGYAFGKASLFHVPAFSTQSLHTAFSYVALAAGVFIIRPTVGLMRNITADGIGGATLRRMLPISLIVPLAIGWARLQGERAGYFDAVTGLAIVVAAMAACLMLLAFVTISPLASVEASTRAAEEVATERIRRLNRVYAVLSTINHVIARERNLATVFEHTCRIAVEQGGFSAAWIALKPDPPGAPLTIAAEAGDPSHGRALRAAVADPAFATSARPAPSPKDGWSSPTAAATKAAAASPTARPSRRSPPRTAIGRWRASRCAPAATRPAACSFCARPTPRGSTRTKCGSSTRWPWTSASPWTSAAARPNGRGRWPPCASRRLRLERAVRAGNVGLWEWSLVSETVHYSSQWKRQLGCEGDEIAPDFEAWRGRIHPDDVDRAIAAIGEYLRGQAPHLEIEYRCRHKDGTYRFMLAHATVLLDERGTQMALLGAHVDVTRHTELQAQFLQAQKMESLGRLAGGIAHDFNNLLTIINGTADLALLRPAGEGEGDDDWRSVRDAGERAATLTRQLLAISRKQVMQVEVLDPNEVLAGIEGLLRRLIGEDVLLGVSLTPDVGRVRADAGQIEQVVVNLAVNARDAMPGGGMLTIETRAAEVVGTMMAAEPCRSRQAATSSCR